MHIE
jgi:hypothetical protein